MPLYRTDEITEELIARFNAKWVKDEKTGCWLWTASLAGKGYGQLKVPGTRRQVYAHRLSYEIHKGPIPHGAMLLHSCDTPRCCNPAHLTPGVAVNNSQDMKAKGRHLYGDRNLNSKLDEKQVVEIKALLSSGSSTHRVAAIFGISQTQVSRIGRGERWAHVKNPTSKEPSR